MGAWAGTDGAVSELRFVQVQRAKSDLRAQIQV